MVTMPVQEIKGRGLSVLDSSFASGLVYAMRSNAPRHVVMSADSFKKVENALLACMNPPLRPLSGFQISTSTSRQCIRSKTETDASIGRLPMFKECLRAGLLPFIVDDSLKRFHYRDLHEWPKVREYLLDTCRTG